MLKEYIQSLEHSFNPEGFDQRNEQMFKIFDNLVDFLRDPNLFPNPEINGLNALMWKLIENKHIQIALDPTKRLPSMIFAVISNNVERIPFLFLPDNFLTLVKDSPEAQIGVLAYMASQCRDYFCGKIDGTNGQEVNLRARAYESEALLTMQSLAKEEELSLRLISFQREILEQFPNGLSDLPEDLRYSTPNYVEIWSPHNINPSLN